MPEILNYKTITINSSPQTVTIPLVMSALPVNPAGNLIATKPTPIATYIITGSLSLTGNVNITPGSGAIEGMLIVFKYQAELITDTDAGVAFSIFGMKFTNSQAVVRATIECLYNGGSWKVEYFPNFNDTQIIIEKNFTNESIPGTAFKDESIPQRAFADNSIPGDALQSRIVTQRVLDANSVSEFELQDASVSKSKLQGRPVDNDKLAFIQVGAIKGGGTGNLPIDIDMNATGEAALLISQGYGNESLPKQMTGMGTINRFGVFNLNPGLINTEYITQYAVTPAEADDTLVSDIVVSDVNFDENSDNKIMMHYKGRVDSIYAFVTAQLTGNGVIEIKDNAGVVMGTITMTTGDPVGTAYLVNPIGNNTFTKGEVLSATTSIGSAGRVKLSFLISKTV